MHHVGFLSYGLVDFYTTKCIFIIERITCFVDEHRLIHFYLIKIQIKTITLDRLLFSHKKLEAVRGLRATKMAEHEICSCTFLSAVYRGVTFNSNLPS